MAFAFVQVSPTNNGTGSVVLTLPAASTAGTLLVACVINGPSNVITAPAGWQLASQGFNTAVFYYANNPGSITTATFTAAGACRGNMSEFSTAAGTTQTLEVTGNAAGNPPQTSFSVTASGANTVGDLGIAAYGDIFSANATGQSWGSPAGYTSLHVTANFPVCYNTSYKLSLTAATQTVVATYSTSTNQTGWAGVFAAFKETAAGGLTVATTTLPDGAINVAYKQQLAASGGTPPYTWAITVGALPAGTSLISSGGRGGAFGGTLSDPLTGAPQEPIITSWEAVVGRTVTCAKWYTGSRSFPVTLDDRLQAYVDLGITAYLCYEPAFNPPTTADFNSLKASLQAFKNAGLNAKVCLFQEVEDHAPTPQQYKALVQFYEPAIHAVYPGGLVHDAAGSKPNLHTAYFPTTLGIGNLVDEYGLDLYGNTYHSGARADAYVALVAATGKPFGFLEMGSSIGAAQVPPDTGPGSVTEYLNYIINIAANNPPGSYMWYTNTRFNIHNVISDPSDFRIPLLQALADTITGTSASGLISGTPTTVQLASFTAKVTDNNAATATAALTINITAASAPVITTTTLPSATVGVAYNQQVVETGGVAPFTFTITAGALPDGLQLGPRGFIFGTPSSVAATSGFTVTVMDVNNQAASQALIIVVVAAVPPPSPAPPGPGLPQVIVEAGLNAADPTPPVGTFILDDPVYGKLDSGNQLADSTSWTDLGAFFLNGSLVRPSTRVQGPLISYQGGTATVTFDNTGGQLDPDNPTGPFFGAIRPMIPFQVRAVYGSVSYPLWSGFVGSFAGADLTYDMGYDEATVTADDGFKILAGINLPAIPPGSDGTGDGNNEDSGARVTRILNAAMWYTDHRRVTVGDSPVQGTLYGDTALNLLQLTADSEIGSLYIDGAGNLTYRHRQAILTEARSTTVQAVFGDLPGTSHPAGTELACIPHRRADDDTTLANDIQATIVGGTLQEAQSATSQRTYLFPRTYARSDLILMDDPTALQWAEWVLSVSLVADDRFDAITIDPLADPANLYPQVLGREIGDRIQVWRRPQNSGAVISQDCFIRGIQHDIDAVNGTWSTTWTLQATLRYTGFLILDDAAKGLLDTGKLAF